MGHTAGTVLGTVASLWRYPVKSMPGEELQAAEVTGRGILGDRCYALVDLLTGKVASAKHPRKWSRLRECRATYQEPPRRDQPPPPVEITLPDGLIVGSEQQGAHQALSEALGREVLLLPVGLEHASYEKYWADIEGMPYREVITEMPLVEGPGGSTFFDGAPLHLLATATLRRLQAHYPAGRFDVRRFRPNIVIELAPDAEEAIETAWIDRRLAIGADVHLFIPAPCVRCVMTTLPQDELPHDPDILRTIARHSRASLGGYGALPSVGVYAEVVSAGTIQRGDPVRLV